MTVAVKNPDRPRVLQLGFGAFGPVHPRAWLRHGFAGRLTIADPSPRARACAASDLPGVEIVDNPREAMAAADIVDVVTPTGRHATDIALALRAGCDILVEKPLTLSTDEALTIAKRIARSDRVLQVGWPMRWHPLAIALRRAVQADGSAVRWIDADSISLKRPRHDSGVLLNDAVHFIDLACWLLDATPEAVTAVLRYPLGRVHEDIAQVTLEFGNDAVARIGASCVLAGDQADPVVPGGWSRKTMVVHTAAGRFEADFMRGVLHTAEATHARDGSFQPCFVPAAPLSFGDVSWDDVMAAQIAGFRDAVLTRMQASAGVTSGLVAISICADARRSALEKRTVRGTIWEDCVRLSLCNEVIREMEFARQCAYAAGLGYAGIELAPFTLGDNAFEMGATERSAVRRSMADAGVALSGLHWLLVAPAGLSITSADPAVQSRTREVLLRLIDLCAELGGDYLVHGSPAQRRITEESDPEAAVRRAETLWAEIGEAARAAGVTYCIEPLATPAADFVTTLAEASAIVQRIGKPALRTMIDTSAAAHMEPESVADAIRRWMPTGLVAHVQLNDANRRGAGQGEDRFLPVLRALRDTGYDSWLAMEPFEYVPDGPGCAARCIGYVAGLLESLDAAR